MSSSSIIYPSSIPYFCSHCPCPVQILTWTPASASGIILLLSSSFSDISSTPLHYPTLSLLCSKSSKHLTTPSHSSLGKRLQTPYSGPGNPENVVSKEKALLLSVLPPGTTYRKFFKEAQTLPPLGSLNPASSRNPSQIHRSEVVIFPTML